MDEHRKDPEYIPKKSKNPLKEYTVTMLIRDDFYHCEPFSVSAESAAHAIDQVTDWLRNHTETCEWSDFEFKYVEERRKKKR